MINETPFDLETVRANNEVYEIIDLDYDEGVLSITKLHKDKNTKGHSHKNKEGYFFISGKGYIHLAKGDDVWRIPVEPGKFIKIDSEYLHRVYNDTDGDLVFICSWAKEPIHVTQNTND